MPARGEEPVAAQLPRRVLPRRGEAARDGALHGTRLHLEVGRQIRRLLRQLPRQQGLRAAARRSQACRRPHGRRARGVRHRARTRVGQQDAGREVGRRREGRRQQGHQQAQGVVRQLMLRVILALAVSLAASGARAVEDPYPWIAAAYVVKRDGALLWAGQPDAKLAPASLAKLMTALLVLERGNLDEPVTVGKGVLQETGTRMGLKPGEKLRAGDLLAARIVLSANSACRALADHVGSSNRNFISLMNARAAKLGLANTHFEDSCGHDRDGQYASAADLAIIAEQVMRYDEYMRLSHLEKISIKTLDRGRAFNLRNTNALIGRYEGAIGLKTGYTDGAGNCLVALAERDGVRVLAVLLNAPNRWWNAVGLLDRAFAAPR